MRVLVNFLYFILNIKIEDQKLKRDAYQLNKNKYLNAKKVDQIIQENYLSKHYNFFR